MQQIIHVFINIFRKSEVAGKHTKKITCGAWNKEGILALGGDDHMLTLSTAEGDRIREIPIQGDISDLQFSKMKADEKNSIGETTVRICFYFLLDSLLMSYS